MARVTVEDCVDKVPNRFDLVLLAAHRARAIAAGEGLTLDRDNDKNPVVALREIAGETVGVHDTRESLISSLQRYVEVDEPEDEELALLSKPDAPEEETLSEQDLMRALKSESEERRTEGARQNARERSTESLE